MILMAGLGNSGKKYENTRHNAGFIVVDKIIKDFELPSFSFALKFNAEISKGIINEKEIIIVKPSSFMNLSGESISKIIKFYKIQPKETIIIHDDIDIPIGKIKIVQNRGAGGHKGIMSIINKIGNKKFIRIRIGICPQKKPTNPEIFVLQKFNKQEIHLIDKSLNNAIKAIDILLKEGIEKASSLFNK